MQMVGAVHVEKGAVAPQECLSHSSSHAQLQGAARSDGVCAPLRGKATEATKRDTGSGGGNVLPLEWSPWPLIGSRAAPGSHRACCVGQAGVVAAHRRVKDSALGPDVQGHNRALSFEAV